MTKLSGVKGIKDSRGRAKEVVIQVKEYEEFIEDFMDTQIAISRKDEETIPAEEVFRKLDKKHRIK